MSIFEQTLHSFPPCHQNKERKEHCVMSFLVALQIKANKVAWHPEVATQLCLSSGDDHTPVIQLWDLRFATSPLTTLENHKR